MDLRPRERSKLRMIFRGLFGGYSAMFHDRPLGCGRAVGNWKGTAFTFDLSKAEDRPYGWRLYDAKGSWDGANTLRVTTKLVSDAGVSPGPPDVPLAFTLERGTRMQFLSECGGKAAAF